MKKRIIGLLVGAMLIGSVSPVYASELTNQVEDTVESSQVDNDDSENVDNLYTGYEEFKTPKTMYIKNGWGSKVYKDVNGTDGKLVKTSGYKDGNKVSVIGQGVYGQIMYYLFSGSNDNKYMVAKAGLQSNKPVVIKKYKKSKKLYVKKATKAYKVTSTGKLKVAKSLKKSAKVTVVGTSTVKKVKYYAIKSGKSTMLVKQSLLSKTKPKTAKPSSKPSTNNSNKPSKSKYNYTYNDKGQKVVTQDNGVPSNAANYAWDDFIRCKMPGVKPHHGDKCIGYKMVDGKKKNIYYNKRDNQCYFIAANGMESDVMHKGVWDHMTDEDWETPGFE
uniref:Uncharacterized protein n=1 Tax=Siphoviridae sp. ct87j35 TaxID=2825356 RepID=A0A8S5V4N8_9CAUD|nr:MAG TPA: hypothetical protein [Siphoviridae sp. ct87j35]